MDLIIILIIIGLVVFWTRDFKFFIYSLGIIEVFFRLLHFIGDNLGMKELTNLINEYVPKSLFDILGKYSTGLFYQVLCWALFAGFVAFEVYLVRYLFKRK